MLQKKSRIQPMSWSLTTLLLAACGGGGGGGSGPELQLARQTPREASLITVIETIRTSSA